ncbi:hypothetical protein [Tateyamaria sp. ANG-S1]|uniref:hypothetical protein n=1 Tax=Tateyamaria sp. ANG-S1 TaxID=1577905 RepID=UPI00187CD153|nr:hypothetical protein [Tateyamaria sp. ANG-S1]
MRGSLLNQILRQLAPKIGQIDVDATTIGLIAPAFEKATFDHVFDKVRQTGLQAMAT